MKIFCVIPAYNETGNISVLTKRLVKVFKKIAVPYKILYVIQGNKDVLAILDKIKSKNSNVSHIYFPKALGIGKAYVEGFKKVPQNYSHVLTMDADLNHQPEELPSFVKAINKSRSDLVIGSRFIEGGSFSDKRIWKRFVSRLLNFFLKRLLKIEINDKSSGYRLMKRTVVKKCLKDIKETGYPFYMEFVILAFRHGFNIKEIPIKYIPRVWGKSKMGKIKTSVDYLRFLVRLIFKI